MQCSSLQHRFRHTRDCKLPVATPTPPNSSLLKQLSRLLKLSFYMELTILRFQPVSILPTSSSDISLNDIKKGLGLRPTSFCICFIIIFPFTLNIYTEFRKMRQGSPWKPIRLLKRTTFKIKYDLITYLILA